MLRRAWVLAIVLITTSVFSGCFTNRLPAPEMEGARNGPGSFSFSEPVLIDGTRAGGEPVIAILPGGRILVSAHPGLTHAEKQPDPALTSTLRGQNHLWASDDSGDTWRHVGDVGNLLPIPRGPGLGPSDPDLALGGARLVFMTELTLGGVSVSVSSDGGDTWLGGNPIAGIVGDRPWLAAGDDHAWLAASRTVWSSSDAGLTWSQVGATNASGDLRYDARTGTLYAGAGAGVDYSTDRGRTWTSSRVPGHAPDPYSPPFTEPVFDLSGNVYAAWAENGTVFLSGLPPDRMRWRDPVSISGLFPELHNGTSLWPWIAAGSEGRVAVSWYGTTSSADPRRAQEQPWYVYTVVLTGAMSERSTYHLNRTSEPVHIGSLCWGTECALGAGDRRLGDFFEIALDEWGRVHVVYAQTADGEALAHPWHMRQGEGPQLYSRADIESGASARHLIG